MTMRTSMWWLAAIWFGGAAVGFLILVGQTWANVHRSPSDVWGWFLPTVMPTLSLIVGTLVAEHRNPLAGTAQASGVTAGPMLLLGALLSLFYLALVLGAIVYANIQVEAEPLTVMRGSNLWLGALQALCVAALGFFFQSKKQ